MLNFITLPTATYPAAYGLIGQPFPHQPTLVAQQPQQPQQLQQREGSDFISTASCFGFLVYYWISSYSLFCRSHVCGVVGGGSLWLCLIPSEFVLVRMLFRAYE